ncbi:RluA family pseudouridine synthase [Aliivibrio finisterrensis]
MSQDKMTHSKFTPFSSQTDSYALPERFTFPYYYAPHPLASLAMAELQDFLDNQQTWHHDFTKQGKMFAVLVVKNQQGELGYLSSFAGTITDSENSLEQAPDFFVDAIFDKQAHHKLFSHQESEIESLKSRISQLESSPSFIALTEKLSVSTVQSEQEISAFQQSIAVAKKERKQRRAQAEYLADSSSTEKLAALIAELGNQSSREKRDLKQLKQQWQQTIADLTQQHNEYTHHIDLHKNQLNKLLKKIDIDTLKATQFINQSGVIKSLFELFKQSVPEQAQTPIPYSSEQNLPKLLQTAFRFDYTPIALGEFWWGSSPYEQVRQHKNLYPVCQSKCFEILEHMLTGINLDESPLEQTPSYGKELDIVYEDDVMVVVNKPAEFLSVSGKFIADSVHARIQARYPSSTGPLIVHRLDMSTSGLLVLTLTPETNKQVQKQFIERTVEKRYTALLEGNIDNDTGIITLPLCGDMEDRPRQMVCHHKGRSAETSYQVIARANNRTKVYLYPKTGRTHQLRVHCSHQAGLNTPIVGDDLYGFKADRLHLHAGYLKLRHPVTNIEMEFEVDAEF